MKSVIRCFLLITLLFLARPLLAEKFDEKFEHWPVDLKINGTIIAANALDDTSDVDERFLRASGGKDARIVGLFWKKTDEDQLDSLRIRSISSCSLYR